MAYQIHPLCAMLPDMSDEQFSTLTADIQANGQIEPCHLFKNQLIDGRHRQKACAIIGVVLKIVDWKPKTSAVESELLAFVMSKNFARRHLNESQRAMIAAKAANMRKHSGKTLVPDSSTEASEHLTSQRQAAASVDVSRAAVQRATQVIREGSAALQLAVMAGDVTVRDAAKIVDLPKKEQNAAVKAVETGEARTLAAARKTNPPTDPLDEIPERLKPIFALVEKFKAFEKVYCPQTQNLADEASRVIFGHIASPPLNAKRVGELMGQIYAIIMPWQPDRVCNCGAKEKGCRKCKGRGWLPKSGQQR